MVSKTVNVIFLRVRTREVTKSSVISVMCHAATVDVHNSCSLLLFYFVCKDNTGFRIFQTKCAQLVGYTFLRFSAIPVRTRQLACRWGEAGGTDIFPCLRLFSRKKIAFSLARLMLLEYLCPEEAFTDMTEGRSLFL